MAMITHNCNKIANNETVNILEVTIASEVLPPLSDSGLDSGRCQCGKKISKQLLCKVVRSTENIQAKLKISQPYEEAMECNI